MPLFSLDAEPAQAQEGSAYEHYMTSTPGLGEQITAAAAEGPLGAVVRRVQRNVAGINDNTPPVSVEDLNKKYGVPPGQTWFDAPMQAHTAEVVASQKTDELKRQEIQRRYSDSHGLVMNLVAGAGGFALDPLNVASGFIPGVGEEALIGRLGASLVGRTASRLLAGASTGALQMAALAPIRMAAGSDGIDDYTLRNAFGDMLSGAATVAAFHAGGHALGDVFGRGIAKANRTAMAYGIKQMLEGEPIDVEPILRDRSVGDVVQRDAERQRGNFAAGIPSNDIDRVSKDIFEKEKEPEVRVGEGETQARKVGETTNIPYEAIDREHPLVKDLPVEEILSRPEVKLAVESPRAIIRTFDVPGTAGSSADGGTTYIDKHIPETLQVKGSGGAMTALDPSKYLNIHEQTEHALMLEGGMPYEQAHAIATLKEHEALRADGFDPASYEEEMNKYIPKVWDEKPVNPPKDLYLKPYPHDKQRLLAESDVGTAPGGEEPVPKKVNVRDPEIRAALTELEAAKGLLGQRFLPELENMIDADEAGLDDAPAFQAIRSSPGANVSRIAKLVGPQLYGSPAKLTTVSLKEMFQNAFDAIKGSMEKGLPLGHIEIHMDPGTRTIKIQDNGSGMSADVLGKQFLQIAGTAKETEKASGGLGIAKMLFLFGNKNLKVTTLRDGVLSTLETTGDDLFKALDDPEKAPMIDTREVKKKLFGKQDEALDMFPDGNGTIVEVSVPETYLDPSTGEKKNIDFPTSDWDHEVLRRSPLFRDIDVSLNGQKLYGIGSTFDKDAFTQFANVNFEWGSARIYVSKNEQDAWGDNMHVLSNGLWQFSGSLKKDPKSSYGENIPKAFYVDLEPRVRPEDAGYPFALNRQEFAKQARDDFGKIFGYIQKQYQQLNFAKESLSFGSFEYLSREGDKVTSTGPQELKPEIPPRETVAGAAINEGDTVTVKDGRLVVNGREIPELTAADLDAMKVDVKDLQIPQEKIDSSKVMLHDNMLVDVDGEMKPLAVAARDRFGDRFNNFTHALGDSFIRLRKAVVDAMGEDYKDLLNEAIGVSFDKEYRGVSIRVPFHGSFLNIAAPEYDDALRAGLGYVGTMIHELAHFKVRAHNANFPAEMQRLVINLEASESFDLSGLKSAVLADTADHADILAFLQEKVNDPRTTTIGNNFKDSGSYQARDGEPADDLAQSRQAATPTQAVASGSGGGAQPPGGVPVGGGVSPQGPGGTGTPSGRKARQLGSVLNALTRVKASNAVAANGGLKAAKDTLLGMLVRVQQRLANGVESSQSLGRGLFVGWQGAMDNAIRKLGVSRAVEKGVLDTEIAKGLFAAGQGAKGPGAQVGQIMLQVLDNVMKRYNQLGARIVPGPDYFAHTSWNSRALIKSGFDAWWKAEEPRMHDDTFAGIVPNPGESAADARLRFAKTMYNAYRSGIHLTSDGANGLPTDRKGMVLPWAPGTNIANKVSGQTVIKWNGPDEWLAHMREFGGMSTIYGSLVHGLERSATHVGLMKNFGTNPRNGLARMIGDVSAQYRDIDPDGATRFEQQAQGLHNVLSHLDGTMLIPHNEMWANIGSVARMLETMIHLGFVGITHLASVVPTLTSEMTHHGVSRIDGISKFMNMMLGGSRSAEHVDLLSELGAIQHGSLSTIASRFQADDHVPGRMAAVAAAYMKATGVQYVFENAQNSAKFLLANNLGKNTHLAYDAISPETREMLHSYGIESDDWDLLRRTSGLRLVEGNRYMSPQSALMTDGAQVRALLARRGMIDASTPPGEAAQLTKRYQQDIADKLFSYFSDGGAHSVITPGALERSQVLGTTTRGSLWGEVARSMAQFKMWPVAVMNQIIGREFYRNLDAKKAVWNVGMILGLTALAGYGRMAANNLIKGLPPPDAKKPADMAQAMAMGGGLGIMGDALFGNINQQSAGGHGIVSFLGGPIAGDADKLVQMYNAFRTDLANPPKTDKRWKNLWSNMAHFGQSHMPGGNLFFMKGIFDYLVWYHVFEAADPGWWERANQKLQQQRQQTIPGYLPGRGIPFTPYGLGL